MVLNNTTNFFDDLADPVYWYVFAACNLVAFILWIVSVLEKNSSQVDRIWPLAPAVWTYVYLTLAVTVYSFNEYKISLARLIIVTILLTASAARLTFVFWRKGYYKRAHEDHRWAKLRATQSKVQFFFVNLLFIGFFQNWVLFSLNSPVWFIVKNPTIDDELNFLDFIFMFTFIASFVYETVADQQQWTFQSRKYKWLAEVNNSEDQDVSSKYGQEELDDFRRGFLTRGLFKWSRHPNYLGELGLWWSLYGFTIASQYKSMRENFLVQKSLLNWSLVPILFFTLVFQLTTYSTEKSSSEKYAEYARYKSRVSKIIPWFTTYKPNNVDVDDNN